MEDGTELVAHCPNPGAMTGLNAPGSAALLAPATSKTAKLPFRLMAVRVGDCWVCVDANRPNLLAYQAIAAGALPPFAGYRSIRREARYGTRGSRIDLLLEGGPDGRACYVEVKNVHLRRESDWAEFPDSVTARGAKHLAELADVAAAGGRAAMLYVVQRGDCDRFRLASDIDPRYAEAFEAARAAGVEMRAYRWAIDPGGATLDVELAIG